MLAWFRRASQAAFLLLFFFGSAAVVKVFFQFDPLAAVSTALASRSLETGMLLSAVVVVLTIVFGRWFCGWVCPLGTLNDWGTKTGQEACPTHTKYYLLAGLAGAAVLGVNLAGWLDPLSLLFRSAAIAVNPALSEALGRERPHYYGNILVGVILAGVLALNFYRRRFWCRAICPLGALLGVVGRRALARVGVNRDACNDCGICGETCPLWESGQAKACPTECLYCLDCVNACPTGAIAVGFGGPRKKVNLGRRGLLASGAAGVGAALLFRGRPRGFQADLIRPPGALAEDEFLARCLRCGECLNVCPTNGLQPAAFEAGQEGAWTPVMKMTVGYCEYECVLCSQACPSGAIRALAPAIKQAVRIGLAYIDRNRCLPYAYGRACIVCEEHCPTPKKAIWFEEVNGIKQPHVDAALCIGCGICSYKCAIKAPPAIQIMSAGETRHAGNGVLL